MNAGSSTVAGERSRVDVIDPRAPGLTRRDALTFFVRQPAVQVLAGMLLVSVVLRLWAGGLGGADLVLLAAMVVLQPFTEWVIHVGILHWRPRRLGRWMLDTQVAREHRLHHARPHDPRHWFSPMPGALLGFAVVAAVVFALLPTVGLGLTFVVGTAVLGLAYEWTHFLCHSSLRPRGRWAKRVVRHHRLHHHKNEHYWMGVSMHMGDRLLGTMASPRDVPTSPSCRDLLSSGRG